MVDNAIVVSKCPVCGVQAGITLCQFEAETDLRCASCGNRYFDDGITQAANKIDDIFTDFTHKINELRGWRGR